MRLLGLLTRMIVLEILCVEILVVFSNVVVFRIVVEFSTVVVISNVETFRIVVDVLVTSVTSSRNVCSLVVIVEISTSRIIGQLVVLRSLVILVDRVLWPLETCNNVVVVSQIVVAFSRKDHVIIVENQVTSNVIVGSISVIMESRTLVVVSRTR